LNTKSSIYRKNKIHIDMIRADNCSPQCPIVVVLLLKLKLLSLGGGRDN